MISMLRLQQHVLGRCCVPGSRTPWGYRLQKGKRSSCSAERQAVQDLTLPFLFLIFCEALKVHPGPRTWEGRVG